MLKLVPPVGPLRALHLKMPTPEVEKIFMASFTRSAKQFDDKLHDVTDNRLELKDRNYDVGIVTTAGQYRLQDDAQAFWLDQLAKKNFSGVSPAIRTEILAYYSDLDAPIDTKKKPKDWQRLIAEVNELKQVQPVAHATATGE